MAEDQFQALVVRESAPKTFTRAVETRSIDDLPAGDVLIRVAFSSLNYKDALSASGNRGVTRNYPHTPGIDAAGHVAHSDNERFNAGDPVVVIGHDLGMNTAGGFGQYIRVPANWVVRLPDGLTPRQAMCYGTAGFTAAMSIDKIVKHPVPPEAGEVLVTGTTGGVGSMAVAILCRLGYRVVAVTGKKETAADFLTELGAAEIVTRAEATDTSSRPLLRGRWAAVVDCVGGPLLETAVKSTQHSAAVAVTGLVASPQFNTTVYPLILRGVTLYGIDSSEFPLAERRRLWQLLADGWRPPQLEAMARDVELGDLEPEIERILAGEQTGRVVVTLG